MSMHVHMLSLLRAHLHAQSAQEQPFTIGDAAALRFAAEPWPLRGQEQPSAPPPMPGYLCEGCLDAPAVQCQPAPWGGTMGVCSACVAMPEERARP